MSVIQAKREIKTPFTLSTVLQKFDTRKVHLWVYRRPFPKKVHLGCPFTRDLVSCETCSAVNECLIAIQKCVGVIYMKEKKVLADYEGGSFLWLDVNCQECYQEVSKFYAAMRKL